MTTGNQTIRNKKIQNKTITKGNTNKIIYKNIIKINCIRKKNKIITLNQETIIQLGKIQMKMMNNSMFNANRHKNGIKDSRNKSISINKEICIWKRNKEMDRFSDKEIMSSM